MCYRGPHMDELSSAVSRAILKPVYCFGIPNFDPQTLKSVKINLCKNKETTVHALVPTMCPFCPQCSQKFLDPNGEDIQRHPPPPLPLMLPSCTTGFHLAMLIEKLAPPKIAGYSTA